MIIIIIIIYIIIIIIIIISYRSSLLPLMIMIICPSHNVAHSLVSLSRSSCYAIEGTCVLRFNVYTFLNHQPKIR